MQKITAMGNRRIKVRVDNDREKYPDRRPVIRRRPYVILLSRSEWSWNGTEFLSLKDLEIIRDYLTEYINSEKSKKEKSKRRNKK